MQVVRCGGEDRASGGSPWRASYYAHGMSEEAHSLPNLVNELPVLRSEEEMEQLQNRMSFLVGDVARASADLEFHLRQLMVSLLDSKYAEMAAAGLGANELVDMCTALVKINHEVTESQREECRAILGLRS